MLLGQPWTRWLVLGLGAALLAAVLVALPQVERNGQPLPPTGVNPTLFPAGYPGPAPTASPLPPGYPAADLPTPAALPSEAYPLNTASAPPPPTQPPEAGYPAN